MTSITPTSSRPVALVTGASRGIGAATARELAAAGYKVIAAARNEAKLADVAASSEHIVPVQLDLEDNPSIKPAVEKLESEHGPIEVLVNNAGFGMRAVVEEVPTELARKMFEVNVIGVMTLTQAVLPGMRERRRGRIVMVSSVVSRVGIPLNGVYSASKFALRGLSDTLRREVKWRGIKIIQIEPGPVATDFAGTAAGHGEDLIRNADSPYRHAYHHMMERVNKTNSSAVSAESVAQLIRRSVQARRPRYWYGIHWIGKWVPVLDRWLPAWLVDRLLGKSMRIAREKFDAESTS